MKCSIIFVLLVSATAKGVSQILVPNTASSPAVENALAFYNTAFTGQLHLYNGKEYLEYPHKFEAGHPYFITTDWSNGTVSFDGNTYKDVSISYNLVTDDVIILNSNKVSKIRLVKEKVSGFSFLGHSFINLPPDSVLSGMAPGFYDVVTKGKVALIARRTKNIQTFVKQVVELKVFSRDHYYLKKDNNYYPVGTKKLLLEQLGDKKKELQGYIKQNRLKFKKEPENAMIKIVGYYNQLTQ